LENIMATSRIALGSVLGTISKTASTLTNIVGTVDAAVGMLNSYVSLHSEQQQDKHIIERATARDQLLEESALVQAERRNELEKRFTDATFKNHYEASYNRLASLFNPEQVAA
jgi:hypothetical protein